MLKNMGAASTIHVDILWWWNTLKERPSTLHTWLLYKSPSVGEGGENLTTKFHPHQWSSWTKKWRWQLYLAIKNNYYKKWIMIKKRKYMEKKREREYVNKERKEKKGKELQDGCSSSRPLLSSRLMIYTHHLCVWFKPCWSPELDHVQPSNCCSNYEAPSICYR
jgi:hypothetical protein